MAFANDDLEPVFTEEVEFAYPDLLAADDPLAQWLTNIGRAVNDLLLGNRRLARDLSEAPAEDGSAPSHEVIYDIKAIAADACELVKFLRASDEVPEVADFIEQRMPEKARLYYQQALQVLEPSDEEAPKEKAFKELLFSARDQSSHYSRINHKLLKQALRRLEEDTEGAANRGTVFCGETFKDFYAAFATEVDWQLFHAIDGEDTQSLKEFSDELNRVMGYLISFGTTAFHCYLRDRESKTTVTEL